MGRIRCRRASRDTSRPVPMAARPLVPTVRAHRITSRGRTVPYTGRLLPAKTGVSRRAVLRSAAWAGGIGAAAGAAFLFRKPRPIEGAYVDNSHRIGHAIRDGRAGRPGAERARVPVVIVGGGIAGLSAAWRMRRLGFEDFVLLEMESDAGGNSRWGQNEISPYPWGAHYVPVPDRRIPLVEELFSELGVLRNGRWDASHLCREPLWRLFIDGEWRPDIESDKSTAQAHHDQFDRFWDRMDYFRRGREFTIPVRSPPSTAALDATSMKSWMVREGFHSERLRWYVDYACRDDYGCSYGEASAWAGIHYFAARAEDEEDFLTWPQGNGWIVQRLTSELSPWLRHGAPAHRIKADGQSLEVVTRDVTYVCEAIVFAAPSFLAPYLMPDLDRQLLAPGEFAYSPWYTANLVIDCLPEQRGAGPAWENVIYGSRGLGYVIATHQELSAPDAPTVWTYYRALAGQNPTEARRSLLATTWSDRKEEVLRDLEQAHPDLRGCVARVDIMRLGHAMIRPVPGFLTSSARERLASADGPVQFANSDLSGISIFEEAQYRGVRAADRTLSRLGYRDLEYAG